MNRIQKNRGDAANSKSNSVNPVNSVSKTHRLVSALLSWFAQNARDLPWRRARDPYAIWVSEIMLQQTQVKTVIPYWERWMRELPTIESLAKAKPAKIHKLWEGLGYYTRVRNMQKAARQIVDSCRRRGDESHLQIRNQKSEIRNKSETPHVTSYRFPDNFADVLALPGIGRYTAGAICSIAFNQPTPILDGNVIRVLTRVFGIEENPREKKTNELLWKMAEELVYRAKDAKPAKGNNSSRISRPSRDSNSFSHLNQSLMELGALVCTPRSPQCSICPVSKWCVAFQTGRQEELPNLGKRTAATTRRFVAFIVERDGRFLVRQRPAGVVNAHLWEFPNVEVGTGRARSPLRAESKVRRARSDAPYQLDQFTITDTKPLCTIKHSITRYRITLEAWRAQIGGTSYASPAFSGSRGTRPSEIKGVWRSPIQLRRLAFSSAHKQILEHIARNSRAKVAK